MNDDEMIAGLIAKDPVAQAYFVKMHGGKIMIGCKYYIRNKMNADDAYQDIIVKIFDKIGGFRRQCHISTWCYKITARHCLNFLIKENKNRTEATTTQADGEIAFDTADPDQCQKMAESDSAMFMAAFAKAKQNIDPKYMRAFELQKNDGMSIINIADAMHTTTSNVVYYIKQAKQKLAAVLIKFKNLLMLFTNFICMICTTIE